MHAIPDFRWRRAWPALLVLAALAGCSSDARTAASADPTPTPAAGVDGVPRAGADSLPAALLGTAPAPRGETVAYFEDDPAAAGYLAAPAGDGPHPAVILIHEWDGLNDRVRQFADAMAEEGYLALAADLYSGRTGSGPEENRALMTELGGRPDYVIANLDAAQRYLRGRDDAAGRVATVGWCFGGGVALSYALGGERHEGTAVFYGSLVTDPDSLAALDHEIYGTFAERDQGIPPEQVARFVEALRDAGVENDVHVYDDVGHGFWLWVDQDPAVRSAPALDAWRRLTAYLARAIGGA